MNPTTLRLHSEFAIGRVDPRLFGGFLEHMGRAIYQGVYQPDSSHADDEGFRTDVLSALRGLGFSVVRYPGGNFVSGYHWQDGVGPLESRPTLRELAWQSIEPNQIGTDEFLSLCKKLDWQPMLAVNLGTGTPEEARNWVEYCNSPAGTRYADMRAANGSPNPHGVKLWCLGNEMDGPWQLGHVPADQYASRALQAAKMMKDVDRSIELVASGSTGPTMETYLDWDRTVLETLGELADYVSLHRYVGNRTDDTPDFLAVANSIDRQIEAVDAVCRYVQNRRNSAKRAYLCFDEWNVWYKTFDQAHMNGEGQFAPHLIEEIFNLEDALVVAGFLNSFIRHADCVKIANIAQIVNVIAPILTRDDQTLLQSIYYPLQMYSRRRTGNSLRIKIDGPTYEAARHGETTYIDASAILDVNRLHIFATNRSPDQPTQLTIDIANQTITTLESAELLTAPDATIKAMPSCWHGWGGWTRSCSLPSSTAGRKCNTIEP